VQVANWSAPLGSAARFLVGREARQKNDESAARELNAGAMTQTLPEGLCLRWLGTAGFALDYEGFTLVIDPHLSRYSLRSVLSNRALKPQAELLDRYVPRADAILVGHTHFDHALDVPELARRRDCKAYGSRSLHTLMGLAGLADRAVAVEPGRVYSLGPFDVTFVRSLHSKLILGFKVNGEGEITCDHLDHMHQGNYRCGQVFGIHIAVAGRTLYHQGSANLVESELLHSGVDYLLCGIAGRGFTPNFTERILTSLRPQTVIAHHHDNFFLPIDEPMGFSFNVNFGGFVEDVRRVSADFEVRVFEPLQSL
jgi:L-ascorbate metabolism protein UlaG (beta-lactamase superfamily)